jgi:hypothetical protein
MQAWRRWLAADVATKRALIWAECCARQQRTRQEERRDQRHLQDGLPFSDREWARLAFVRWQLLTGHLGPPGYDTVCTRRTVTPHCCSWRGEEMSRTGLRRRALQLALALLLVALAATWLVAASANGPGDALPTSPPAPFCLPAPVPPATPAQLSPGSVTLNRSRSAQLARDRAPDGPDRSPVASHCPLPGVIVSEPAGAAFAGDLSPVPDYLSAGTLLRITPTPERSSAQTQGNSCSPFPT